MGKPYARGRSLGAILATSWAASGDAREMLVTHHNFWRHEIFRCTTQ